MVAYELRSKDMRHLVVEALVKCIAQANVPYQDVIVALLLKDDATRCKLADNFGLAIEEQELLDAQATRTMIASDFVLDGPQDLSFDEIMLLALAALPYKPVNEDYQASAPSEPLDTDSAPSSEWDE